MGGEYKTFLGVPCSFFLHGWQWFFCSWAVPGGLGGMKVGMSMVHLTLCSNLTVPSIYSRTEHHCRLPCQTSANNLSLNSIAICAIMVQRLCQDDVALYVSRCCADIERNRSKKETIFCKKPCLASPDPLYMCRCLH